MALAAIRVQGFTEVAAALRAVGGRAEREWRRALRDAVAPLVGEIKSRLSALGGTGPHVAKSVKLKAQQRFVGLSMGGPAYATAKGVEFGAKRTRTRSYNWSQQFGKGISFRGVKQINYSSPQIFGPWTGNQFTVSSGATAGRAFYPTIVAALPDVQQRLAKVVAGWTSYIARAGAKS